MPEMEFLTLNYAGLKGIQMATECEYISAIKNPSFAFTSANHTEEVNVSPCPGLGIFIRFNSLWGITYPVEIRADIATGRGAGIRRLRTIKIKGEPWPASGAARLLSQRN